MSHQTSPVARALKTPLAVTIKYLRFIGPGAMGTYLNKDTKYTADILK